ncbi:hypothetical protein BGX27_004089 [Mortierella sp. AM989]|nr:hypothetical protein BGX27_004089 [Mortierella sp. AM989]
MVRFRKSSNSITYSVLYWTFLSGAIGTLVYYAYNRVSVVLERNFFIQSEDVYASGTNILSAPSFILCLTNAEPFDATLTPHYWSHKHVSLVDPTIPEGQKIYSPCYAAATDMYIFSTFKDGVEYTYGGMAGFNFSASVRGPNARGRPGQLFIVPHEDNPFQNTTFVPKTGVDPFRFSDIQRNSYNFYQNSASILVTATLQRTKVLRNDFLGLFGSFNESATTYVINSNSQLLENLNVTMIRMWWPVKETESYQVLVVSAPEALSSWGGAFSLIVSIFVLLFGDRPFSPFGLIQKYILKSSTKKKIAYVCKKEKDADDGNSSLATLDGNYLEAEQPKAPLPFLLGPTRGAESQQNNRQQDLTAVHHQQQQIHHEELVSLREQVQILQKALRHSQKNEQRVKEIEILLREFYLDMDLVQPDGENPKSTKSNSPSIGLPFTSAKSDTLSNNRDLRNRKENWSPNSNNTEPVHGEYQEYPMEETTELRRAEHGMGSGQAYHPTSSPPASANLNRSAAPAWDPPFELKPI